MTSQGPVLRKETVWLCVLDTSRSLSQFLKSFLDLTCVHVFFLSLCFYLMWIVLSISTFMWYCILKVSVFFASVFLALITFMSNTRLTWNSISPSSSPSSSSSSSSSSSLKSCFIWRIILSDLASLFILSHRSCSLHLHNMCLICSHFLKSICWVTSLLFC